MGDIALEAIAPPATRVSEAVSEAAPDLETARLAQLARQGDREAFARLVDLHQQSAWRVAMAALGRHDEAEDAAQDGFISAWNNLGNLRDDERFRPWLLSIVWRKALDRRRGIKAWLRVVALRRGDPDAMMWTIEDSPDLAPSPETATISRSAAMAARKIIASLPSKLRDPLLLAASGDYRYEEIAAMLGTPLGTVKWRVSEARRIVKSKLDRLEGGRS
ncbi:MAG: RNA polymerase sigma factor [Vicinamibacterales bacterium]